MILKKQLLDYINLNNAYVSKIDTNTQTMVASLNVNGGQVTLKNTVLSDNASSSYYRIDPQGNKVIIYDGVSNQEFDVFSSSGSEWTYLTTVNQASNASYGLLDVAGTSVAKLNINTNSLKPVNFGGNVYVSGNTGIGTASPSYKLDINGDTAIRGNLYMTGGTRSINVDANQRMDLIFPTNGNWNGIHFAGLGVTNGSGASGFPRLSIYQYSSTQTNPTDLVTGILTMNSNGVSHGLRMATENGNIYLVPSTGKISISTDRSPAYAIDVAGDIASDGWHRARGSTGFFFEDRGGGWYMPDSTWIRSYTYPDNSGNAKGIMIEKNTAAINNSSYDQGHIEMKTYDNSNPILGFHRSGSTALGLYHNNLVDILRIRSSSGQDYALMFSGSTNSTVLNDTNNMQSGHFTNSGTGLLNNDGTSFIGDWWHISHFTHYDRNGYASQLAVPFYNTYDKSMYFRGSSGGTWGDWRKVWDNKHLATGATAPPSPQVGDLWVQF